MVLFVHLGLGRPSHSPTVRLEKGGKGLESVSLLQLKAAQAGIMFFAMKLRSLKLNYLVWHGCQEAATTASDAELLIGG